MFAIYERTKTGKILVAVLAIAMVVAGCAIVMSDSGVDGVSASTLTPDKEDSTKITLTEDVTLEDLSFPAGVTSVDLAGHTMNLNLASDNYALSVSIDSSADGGKVVTNRPINVWTPNTLTIENVTIESSANRTVDLATGTNVTFTNVIFAGNATTAVYMNDFSNGSAADVTLDGCTFNDKYVLYTTDKSENKASLSIQNTKDGFRLSIDSSTSGTEGGDVTYGSTTSDIKVDSTSNTNLLNVQLNQNKNLKIVDNTNFTPSTIGGEGSVYTTSGSTVTADVSEVPVTGEDPDSIDIGEYQLPDAGSWNDVKDALATGEATISSSITEALDEPITVHNGEILNIRNATLTSTEKGKIIVEDGGTLNISNSFVYIGADISENGQLNVSGAHTLTADGVTNSDLSVGIGDTLNLTGSIPSERTVSVYGNLVATDVTVAGTIESFVGSTVTLNGTSNINGKFIMNDSDMEISGTVFVRNDTSGDAAFTLNGTSEVTVLSDGVFNVNRPTAIAAQDHPNTLTIGADSKFIVEGTLNVTGTVTGTIQNKGTITFNGSTGSAGATVNMFNGVSMTVVSVDGKLTVNDTGAVKDVAGNRYAEANASEGHSIVLTDVRGVMITETVTNETFDGERFYYSNMDISGTFLGLSSDDATPEIGINASTDTVTVDGQTKVGQITLSGTSTIGSGVTVSNNGKLTVTGDLTITPQTGSGNNSNPAGILDNTAVGAELTVEGSITIQNEMIRGDVNAVRYSVTGTTGITYTYTNFAAAIDAAADADSNSVYVEGEVAVSADDEVAAGTYVFVMGEATLTINLGITLTVADNGALYVEGTVDVRGTLIVTNTDTGLTYGTLHYDVYTVNGKTATYTSLANALANSNPGDVITIAQDVTITDDLTIPVDVTVQTGNHSIILEDGVTLTVQGTLAIQNNGTLDAGADNSLVWGDDVILIVDGVVSDTNASADTDMTKYNASGAVFELRNTMYLTSVEYAASVSDQIEESINIYGNVSFDDVTFTEGDGNQLVVTFKNLSGDSDDNFRGNITLDGVKVCVSSGLYSGTITGPAGSVQFSNAYGFEIEADVDTTGLEDVDVLTLGGIAVIDKETTYNVHGSITVASGTVTAANIDVGDATHRDAFTVASGATFMVADNMKVNVDGEDTSFTIDGTIEFDDGQMSIANGATAVINGTMTVENTSATDIQVNGTLVVAGDLNISTAQDTAGNMTVAGTMLVGAVPTTLGQTTSGNVSGRVTADSGLIIVYTGSSIENIDIGNSQFITTKYYINEVEYATAYAIGTKTIQAGLGTIELDGIDFESEATVWYSDDVMTKEIEDPSTSDMADYENVYISAPLSIRTGTISAGTGLDLYIDNVKWTTGNTLPVGTHTVSFNVQTGYDGSNAVITFNGQTVQNGGTIEITSNGFVLIANGAVPSSGSTVVIDNGGSSDMGLTDYLLIILVILIVIMAIIVALRLMRS